MQDTPSTLSLADRLIPWYFVLFFVALTMLLSYFTWLAVHSFTGVVTENAYQEGVDYNRIIQQSNEQEALGWRSDIAITQKSQKHLKIAITLKDKNGLSITGAKGKLTIQRPTQAGYDKVVSLEENPQGTYTSEIELPLTGIWDLFAAFVRDKDQFQVKKTYIANP